MGWFSVVKGAYPGLDQIDRCLPVGTSETSIQRGSLVYEDDSDTSVGPQFRLAGAAQAADPRAYIYFSLVDQTNFTAGMAGSYGQGPAGGVAKITGLAVGMPLEVQTDQFDTGTGIVAGDLLAPGAGGLVTTHAAGQNCIGQCTKAPFSRWVNDAVAVAGRRTGANVEVINLRTMWLPGLVGTMGS